MDKFEFRARSGSNLSDEKAVVYGARLYELMTKLDREELSPFDVVEDAKDESTPYHDYFEWNNKSAGEQYRLRQARGILNGIVKVKVFGEEEPPVVVRAFHCVVTSEPEEENRKRYVPEEVVFNDKNFSSQVIDAALREAESWNNRYRVYKELHKISLAIVQAVEERRKKVKSLV